MAGEDGVDSGGCDCGFEVGGCGRSASSQTKMRVARFGVQGRIFIIL